MFGKAAKGAAKGTVATKGGRRASKVGAKAATKAAKGASRIAIAGGKGQAKLARQALSSGEPASTRILKYGFFAVAGFAIGALVARAGGKEGGESSLTGGTGPSHPDPGSPAGRRGETWGSGTPLGTSGPGGPGPASGPPPPGGPAHQRPGEPPRTGAERDYSDPSSGPLIGEHHDAGAGGGYPRAAGRGRAAHPHPGRRGPAHFGHATPQRRGQRRDRRDPGRRPHRGR